MPDQYQVVVVIPAYNAEGYVGQAIASVLAQTHRDLQVVVVDDGSTDGTVAVANSFRDTRLTVFSGPNRGVSAARNRGARAVDGDFVAFLDADDTWCPDKVAVQLDAFAANPDLVAVGSLLHYESLGGARLGTAGQMLKGDDHAAVAEGRLMPFPISSILIRRHTFESIGGFDERLSIVFPGLVDDLDLLARLAQRGGLYCVDRVLGSYRVHGASASARHFASQRLGTRFVRARVAAEARGETLSPEEFLATFRLTLRQRHGDLVSYLYRNAGLATAERHFFSAARYALGAFLLGPRYTLARVMRQRRKAQRA